MIKDLLRVLRVMAVRTKVGGQHPVPSSNLAIFFAPHPDDEVLGCCGLMQRLLAEGKRVELVLMTGGGKSHAGCCGIDERELVIQRRRLTLRAAEIYGLPERNVHFLDYPDGEIKQENAQTDVLLGLLKQLLEGQEDVAVFYPHRQGEGWADHIATSHIAARLCDELCPVAKQYEYCVWFWFYNCWKIDWGNACLLRLNGQEYAIKLRAIDEYIVPKAPCGKPWSGVLPPVFLWANKWNKELYFRVK